MANCSEETWVFQRSANTPIFATGGNERHIMAGAKTTEQPAWDDMERGCEDKPNLETKEDSDNEDRLDHLEKMDQIGRLSSVDSCYVSNGLDEPLSLGAGGDGTTPITAAANAAETNLFNTGMPRDPLPCMLCAADTTGLAEDSATDITGDAEAAVMLQPDSGLSSSPGSETGVSSQELESPFDEHDGLPGDLEHDGPPDDTHQSWTSAASLTQSSITSSTSDAAIGDGEGGLSVVQDNDKSSTNSSFEVLSQASAVDDGHLRGNRATLVNYLLDQSWDTGLRLQEIVEPRFEASDEVLVPHAGNNAAIANHMFDYEAGAGVATNVIIDPEGCIRTESLSEDDEIDILEREGGNHDNLVMSDRESSVNHRTLNERWERNLHVQMPPIQNPMPFSEDFSTRVTHLSNRWIGDAVIYHPPTYHHQDYVASDIEFLNQTPEEQLRQATSIYDKCSFAAGLMSPGPFLTVERANLNDEIHKHHQSDDKFWKKCPTFTYAREWGIDVGGVTRDVFSHYWEKVRVEVSKSMNIDCFGTTKCTPGCLCDLYSRPFAQGVVLAKYVPYYFSEALVLALFCVPDKVTAGHVQRCVQLFKEIWPNEVQLMLEESCLYGVSSMHKDDLEGLFSMYGSLAPLTLNNPKQFQLRLDQVVIEWMYGDRTPHFIEECRWKLFQMLGPLGPENANEVWNSIQPSGRDVIDHLICMSRPDVGTCENQVFEFFKLLLIEKSDEKDQIRKILKYITGSPSLTGSDISVEFSDDCPQGFPKVSTCFQSITLPSNFLEYYEEYEDFKTLFLSLLGSPESGMFTRG